MIAIQQHLIHGVADLALGSLHQSHAQIFGRKINTVKITRDAALRGEHHDRGGVRELLDLRIVLMIGVNHDHDLAGHLVDRCPIAGLLIAAVAAVLRMHHNPHGELSGQFDGSVGRGVVNQQDLVDPSAGDVVICRAQRLFRVVSGKNGHDFLLVKRHGTLAARVTQRLPRPIPPLPVPSDGKLDDMERLRTR